ncbi:EexN family lipoprotein [Arcobacter lacus]|uniref:EexN family lipoprotein n=1 Tax=Arcobacter lacus TaxID=1912876 RepID=UPI0021BAE9E3|nr:EexN family lipoprotein [Arcobacter lacus]MCT7910709.1 EexN family lipoprotein [Arcobacter lacus]
MKKVILKTLFFIGAISLLTGCQEEKIEIKTVEYYSQHLEEAKARVSECKKLEKANENQQLDCSNAQEAVIDNKANRKSVNDNSSYESSDFVRKVPENPYK